MRILYISDIHAQINNYQSKRMRRKLLDKISELNSTKPFDYLYIGGDITNQGQPFSDIHIKLVKTLLETLKIDVNQLFIVPGNHDLTRNTTRTDYIENLLDNTTQSPSDLLDAFIKDEKNLEILMSSFQNFNEFHKLIKGEAYPLTNIHNIVKFDSFNLLLLNTCLIANKSGEEGNLLIAKDSLFECLDANSNETGLPTIAMGHHTLDCFADKDKTALLNLFDDYGVQIYLSGHVHQANYSYESNRYNNLLAITCSAVHYDQYTIGGFVDLNIKSTEACITQYVWNSEHEYWTKNNSLGRRMENGSLIHKFNENDTDSLNSLNEQLDNVKTELSVLFSENERIFKQYGPQSIIAQQKPYSELAYIWKKKSISTIIPNNSKILELFEKNINLIPEKNRHILNQFRDHIEGFKNNQLSEYKSQDIPLFPKDIYNIFN